MTDTIEAQETRPDLRNDVDRLFAEVSSRLFDPCSGDPQLWAPPTDVEETPAAYTIAAEVPGIPKEKLDIRIRGATVEIRGKHGTETNSDGKTFVYRERQHHGYYRRVELPEPVVAGEAKATVENGVLTLELPKEHPTTAPAEVKVRVA